MQKEDTPKNDNKELGLEPYSISKSQKLAVIVLAFFAFLTIVMWSIQFKKSLTASFRPEQTESASNVSGMIDAGIEDRSEADLRNKDTDEDGLNDWEELNIYMTSPYLKDSDSDGFDDKTEVDSGNDPNCPRGRDCYGDGVIEEKPAVEDILESSDNLDALPDAEKMGDRTPEIEEFEEVMYVDGDVSELRAMLIESGMDEKLLEQVSDNELLELFRETIEEN